MIQPHELRIGNWVIHNNPLTGKSVYHQVTVGTFSKLTFHAREYEPIPLTPEWLEKCGFYYKDGATEYGTESKNGVELYVHDEDPGYFHFSKGLFNGTKTEIKYLHQLQNLYFCETGEELPVKL